MRGGVSFPSYEAAWSAGTGTWSADHPPSALADLGSPRSVALCTGAGVKVCTATLTTPRPIRFVGLVHHTAAAGDTVSITLFSSGAPDPVANAANIVHQASGLAFPDPVDGYAAVYPHLLEAEVTVGAVHLEFDTAGDLEIGAVELSGWWEWADVEVDREFGIASGAQSFGYADGVAHVTAMWSPRVLRGSRALVDLAELDVTGLDFQLEKGLSRPFVFVADVDDSDTWARQALLAVNERVPPLAAAGTTSGRLSFALREHLA